MKYYEKMQARALRQNDGLSIKTIAKKVGVAASSVSLWVRDIQLTEEQEAVLLAKNSRYYNQVNGGSGQSAKARKKRREYQEEGRQLAIRNIDKHLFPFGCAIFWAEGTKDKNRLQVSNTDPDLLQIWKEFLSTYFVIDISDISIKIQCHLGNGKTQDEIENYWLETLKLPSSCLRKTHIVYNHVSSKRYKKNKHPYGVCAINIHSTQFSQQVFGAIKYLANINDENKWLF